METHYDYSTLPDELIICILKILTTINILKLSLTCKKLFNIIQYSINNPLLTYKFHDNYIGYFDKCFILSQIKKINSISATAHFMDINREYSYIDEQFNNIFKTPITEYIKIIKDLRATLQFPYIITLSYPFICINNNYNRVRVIDNNNIIFYCYDNSKQIIKISALKRNNIYNFYYNVKNNNSKYRIIHTMFPYYCEYETNFSIKHMNSLSYTEILKHKIYLSCCNISIDIPFMNNNMIINILRILHFSFIIANHQLIF
jgi:hypothetical protein